MYVLWNANQERRQSVDRYSVVSPSPKGILTLSSIDNGIILIVAVPFDD